MSVSPIDVSKVYLPQAEFDAIYSRVPRLTVEVLIRTDEGTVLTKRSIEPCKGQWHIPGGTVYFGEPLEAAVQRIALAEVGVEVKVEKLLGYIEYRQMLADGYRGWPVGITFAAQITGGQIQGSPQGEEVGQFKELPASLIAEQAAFLAQHLEP
jgi:ADP-ribose pyrophosphatase YjhB (NUDIX family)